MLPATVTVVVYASTGPVRASAVSPAPSPPPSPSILMVFAVPGQPRRPAAREGYVRSPSALPTGLVPPAPGSGLRLRIGFEIELLAPPGSSRADLAAEVARRSGGGVHRFFHTDSEPSLVPGLDHFIHLTPGFDVVDERGRPMCRLVDDITIRADLDPRVPPRPGWYRIVGDEPDLFARVVAANTTLPLMAKGANPYHLPADVAVDPRATNLAAVLGPALLQGPVPMFNAWIKYCLTSPTFVPSDVMRLQIRGLSDAEAVAYDAPFPSYIYEAGPRTLPSMIVAVTDNNAAAWASAASPRHRYIAA